jgi:DegV family protein with EDD domain
MDSNQPTNKKQKIGLVCDEGGDLPKEIIEKYKISIVPFKVEFGELAKFPENIYQKIREAEKRKIKAFIKTSQPSPGDFLSTFKEKLEDFEEIICITITSKHSGTFNSALQARNFLEKREKIHVFDSLSGSAGQGLIILKAVSLIEKELKIEEILENLKKSVSKTHLIFMLQDPERLEASGRLPHILASWLRAMQKIGIRPLMGIKDGKIKPIGIKKGVKDIATALFKEFETKISKVENKIVEVAITHADNLKEAEKLKEMIEKIKNCEIIFVNLIGNILGGLAGPGAIALAWQEYNPL